MTQSSSPPSPPSPPEPQATPPERSGAPSVYRIAVIPGDGIGTEVIPEGLRVLERLAEGSEGRVVLRDAAGRSTGELSLQDAEPNQDLDWDVSGPVR